MNTNITKTLKCTIPGCESSFTPDFGQVPNEEAIRNALGIAEDTPVSWTQDLVENNAVCRRHGAMLQQQGVGVLKADRLMIRVDREVNEAKALARYNSHHSLAKAQDDVAQARKAQRDSRPQQKEMSFDLRQPVSGPNLPKVKNHQNGGQDAGVKAKQAQEKAQDFLRGDLETLNPPSVVVAENEQLGATAEMPPTLLGQKLTELGLGTDTVEGAGASPDGDVIATDTMEAAAAQ